MTAGLNGRAMYYVSMYVPAARAKEPSATSILSSFVLTHQRFQLRISTAVITCSKIGGLLYSPSHLRPVSKSPRDTSGQTPYSRLRLFRVFVADGLPNDRPRLRIVPRLRQVGRRDINYQVGWVNKINHVFKQIPVGLVAAGHRPVSCRLRLNAL